MLWTIEVAKLELQTSLVFAQTVSLFSWYYIFNIFSIQFIRIMKFTNKSMLCAQINIHRLKFLCLTQYSWSKKFEFHKKLCKCSTLHMCTYVHMRIRISFYNVLSGYHCDHVLILAYMRIHTYIRMDGCVKWMDVLPIVCSRSPHRSFSLNNFR